MVAVSTAWQAATSTAEGHGAQDGQQAMAAPHSQRHIWLPREANLAAGNVQNYGGKCAELQREMCGIMEGNVHNYGGKKYNL